MHGLLNRLIINGRSERDLSNSDERPVVFIPADYQTHPYVKLKSHSARLSEASQVLQIVYHVRRVPLHIMEAMLSLCFQCTNDTTKELM